MENVKQETHIYHNINKNYGAATIAQGNVESVNNVTLNDSQYIKELVESLKDLIIKEEFDEKEEVIDDLETIEQEVNSDNHSDSMWGALRETKTIYRKINW